MPTLHTHRSLSLLSLALVIAPAVLSARPAAAEVRSGDTVVIAAGERVDGNLYVSAATVVVHGEIDGDLVAAGGSVVVDGHVQGDVLAAGSDVSVGGVVDGDVRIAGGRLAVNGSVGGDVAAGGGDVVLGSAIGGDAFVAAGSAAITGAIGGGLALAAGDVLVGGAVAGDVDATSGTLHLGADAAIQGHLAYTGDDLQRAAGAVVVGSVVEHAPPSRAMNLGLLFVGWLQALIGMCIFGALWLTLFRGFATRAMNTLGTQPARSFGVGLLVLMAAPVVLAVVFALGAVIGGWWMSAIGVAVYGTAIAIAFPLVAAFLGRVLFAPRSSAPIGVARERWAMLGVLVVLSLAMAVPFVGGVLGFAVVVFGLGATAVTLVPTLRQARVASSSSAMPPLQPIPV